MPISILGLNRSHDGAQEHHEVEISSLDDIDLLKPFKVQITVTKLRHDIYDVHITGDVVVQLDCHRCLKPLDSPIHIDFHTVFADEPDEEEWPIAKNDIDIDEPVRQEILFLTPTQLLCQLDCSGIQSKN